MQPSRPIDLVFELARLARANLTISFYPDIPYTIARCEWKGNGVSLYAERVDTTPHASVAVMLNEVWGEVERKLTIAQAINEAPL